MDGFLNVHKPTGMTSYDVVHQIKRIASEPHVGHGGTLDPLASGVLLVALGKMTRLLEYVLKRDKSYRATLELGKTSDSYDREGKIEIRNTPRQPELQEVENVLNGFVGKIEQLPPAFSAVHIDGTKAYKLARKGVLFTTPSREIEIYGIQLLRYRYPLVEMDVSCSTGTYIRSLAHDIGQTLETGAILSELCRLSIGEKIKLENAVPLETLTTETLPSFLMSNESILDLLGLPSQIVSPNDLEPMRQGKSLAYPVEPLAHYCLVSETGTILAIGRSDDKGASIHPKKVFI